MSQASNGGLTSSRRIFCTMKVATVLESSEPISIVRRHSGMISVLRRKFVTSVSSTWERLESTGGLEVSHREDEGGLDNVCAPVLRGPVPALTSAPITPKLVRRRYSNGRVLDTVFRNGYRKSGMCAARREMRAASMASLRCLSRLGAREFCLEDLWVASHTLKEVRPRLLVRSYALKEGQRVAYSVRRVRCERRRREERIDGNYLLQQRRNDAVAVPQDGRKVRKHIPLFAEVQESVLSCVWVLQSCHKLLHRGVAGDPPSQGDPGHRRHVHLSGLALGPPLQRCLGLTNSSSKAV